MLRHGRDVIQFSVVKLKPPQEYDMMGGVGTLVTDTTDLVDGYVMAVDTKSDGESVELLMRALDSVEKPVDWYENEWCFNYSLALNNALDRVQEMAGPDAIAYRGDDDMRWNDVNMRKLRKYVQRVKRDVIRVASMEFYNSEYTAPSIFIRNGRRFVGKTMETLEYPDPILEREIEFAPVDFNMYHYHPDGIPNIDIVHRLCDEEAAEIMNVDLESLTPEEALSYSRRMNEVQSTKEHFERSIDLAMAALSHGYEKADCLNHLSTIFGKSTPCLVAHDIVLDAASRNSDDIERCNRARLALYDFNKHRLSGLLLEMLSRISSK